MKTQEIKELFEQFEAVAAEYEGVECWSAREMQFLLGYSKWENFVNVIDKAKDACTNAGEEVIYHFPDVRKMINLGVQSKDLKGQNPIEKEHVDNNLAVRNMLTKRNIIPENLSPAEDVKKLQRKHVADEKKALNPNKKNK